MTRSHSPETTLDAPHWTLDAPADRALFGKTLLINRPREDLFDAWQVGRFPQFMENVEQVDDLGDGLSRMTIKAPGGTSVTLLNRISYVDPGKQITWQSEEGSDIANSGMVRFSDAPGGRGTYVSLVVAYDPPGGKAGRLAAKVLQREPEVQARRDLHRFKQLMETGEVTTNASPSGRDSESPDQSRI